MTNEEYINRLQVMKLFLIQARDVCAPIIKDKKLQRRTYASDIYRSVESTLSVIDGTIKILKDNENLDAAIDVGLAEAVDELMKRVKSL